MSKTHQKRQVATGQYLRQYAREHNLSPDDFVFYQSNRVSRTKRNKVVSILFNAVSTSARLQFMLKAMGKPTNYYGVITKQYDVPAMMALFQVSRVSLWHWMETGHLPEPAIRLTGKREQLFWFYHQVQPLFMWYHHMKARGIHRPCNLRAYSREYRALKRLQAAQTRRWYAKLGIEYTDSYTHRWGKYGVSPLSDD